MDFYRILRDNKELGPFSLDEIKKMGLKSSDLIWVDGKSAAWHFPDEINGLLTQIEKKETPVVEQPDNEPVTPKPKKRYRLTADHRMVEITEEEAESSSIPRIAAQPPAPKEDFTTRPVIENVEKPKIQEEPLAPLVEPFSKKNVPASDSFELPLEPELSAKPRTSEPLQEFVDIDQNDETDMAKEKNPRPSNTGAFVFAGLLFVVAIGFFGYKWYQDQNNANVSSTDTTNTKFVDTSTSKDESFANSQAIALQDDTAGRAERNKQLLIADSVRRKRIADKNAAIAKAKKDSIANATALNPTPPTVDENEITPQPPVPKVDSAKGKVKKIYTTEDIGKYVKVGVVQPNSAVAGVKGVKLVVHNINNRNLSKVHINVMYFDDNGNIIKRATIIAPNVMIGKSVTIPVADDPKASNVAYKVTGLLGDHVNLQAK